MHANFLTMIAISLFFVLRKGVYPYEYIDDCEKYSETPLLDKKDFCIHLKMEDITDAEYAHVKRVCKAFEI